MSQQPYDRPAAAQAGPHFPPPQFPPPTEAPGHPAAAYRGPYYGAPPLPPGGFDRAGGNWGPASAVRPSPLWGLTIPAAILAFPLGLVAVYFSSQVSQRLQAGDMAGAAKNAGLARTWGIILLALGAFFTLIYLGAGA
jgi:interferon-induced transmembrane protein